MEQQERIYCAAIWYKKITPKFSPRLGNPKNITEGVVILGHRHGDIIKNLNNLTGLRTVTEGVNSCGEHIQGFLTNKNRFVSRKEAADIAIKANQIIDLSRFNQNCLYSEDIY